MIRIIECSFCLLILTIAVTPKKIDPRFDDINRDLICYSKYDKSRVVRCPAAAGCVHKEIVSKYKEKGEYSTDYYHRVGCDSRTFDKTLLKFKCDASLKNGTDYTLDYMLEGDDSRSRPRLWIRKTCCFHPKCNQPRVNALRFWFRKNQTMISVMSARFTGSKTTLLVAVFTICGSLLAYGVITCILEWVRSKQAEGAGQKNKELEPELIADSDFDPGSIIETELKVTGRLNIRETAALLSRLPDMDIVKHSMSRTKSMSSEESSRGELKLISHMPTLVESEAHVDKKHRHVALRPPLRTHSAGWGHFLWNTVRTINSPYDLLYRMIEHGPYQYPFTAIELLALFEETAFKMADEPSLLQIDADITVIGDIRGRYIDLHRWLQLTGWPPRNRILFLGGILDNQEPGSVECLALICSLKCRFPKHVYLLRGEPETSPFRMSQRLHPIITRAVESCVKRMCSQMPFAAIIGKSILCVYSGFSPMIREKAHIHQLFRPVTAEHLNDVERHIIFNQPSARVRMYRPNPKSQGDWFGKQAVKRACKAMRCNVMIRGQSCAPNGYLPCWNNRLINLWSAPGVGTSTGAVLSISKELIITPILMEQQKTQ